MYFLFWSSGKNDFLTSFQVDDTISPNNSFTITAESGTSGSASRVGNRKVNGSQDPKEVLGTRSVEARDKILGDLQEKVAENKAVTWAEIVRRED